MMTREKDKNRMMFIDATHIKAAANNHKYITKEAHAAARYYEASLKAEIEKDREEHGKKPLKDKDDNDRDNSGGSESDDSGENGEPDKKETKEVKISTTLAS